MKEVYCPVIKERINGTDCGIICDVADGMFKKEVLPEGVIWNEVQRKICMNCIYHYPIKHCVLKNGRKVVVIEKNDYSIFASDDVDPENWKFFRIEKNDILKHMD